MASIIELIKFFDVDSKEFESVVHDLLLNNNDIPFGTEEVDIVQNIIITGINSRINRVNTRYDGLLILDRILPRCSKDILSKYSILWITKATQMLENVHSSIQDLTLVCKVLGFLIGHCKDIHELHKQISMQNIKQLINALNALQTEAKCGAVYYLVAVLLYHYPEVCERFQGLIKKMILIQIDSVQENLINASAKCYVLLSKATERSFKPPPDKSMYTGWTYNEALLCNSLHAIMDDLFTELIDLRRVDIWDQLDLSLISEKNVIQYHNDQKQRFSNLCVYLSSMLRGYEARNSVLLHDILTVLCRGLAITPYMINKDSLKGQMLYMILPKLHISLFSVLDALINGFAQELIPSGTTILQLFQQSLQWSSVISEDQITFSNNKLFKNVKICIYKCLSSWLINTGSLSGIETIANDCLTSILKDITPPRDRILLTVQKMNNLSKRAIKRIKTSQYEDNLTQNNAETSIQNGYLDADLCREALIVLQNMFFSGNILLKSTFYKYVQNVVVSLLYNHYLDLHKQSFYKDYNECRLELFKVLKALQMNSHMTIACPTQYCLEISDLASRDIDLRIVQEAKLALTELEKIIHPAIPTLQLPQQPEGNNESIPENYTEEIGIIQSDNGNKVAREYTTMQCTNKRRKINMPQSSNNIEQIKITTNVVDLVRQAKTDSDKNTENISREKDHDKEENLSDINEITHSEIETKKKDKCTLATYVIENKKQEKQIEKIIPSGDLTDEILENEISGNGVFQDALLDYDSM